MLYVICDVLLLLPSICRIPDSAFLRFMVHLVRAILVGLIVCLWLFCAIQTFVCFAKCMECIFIRQSEDDGAGSSPASTESTVSKVGQDTKTSTVKEIPAKDEIIV